MENLKDRVQILRALGCTAILITDGDGIVTYVDAEYFRSVVGLEEKDLVGKSAYVLEAEQLIKPVLATKVIATKAPITEISNLRGNYQNIGEAFPLFDENGKIKEILSYSRDMVFETEIRKKYMKLLSEIDLMKLNDEDSQENWSIVGEGLKTYNNNFRITIENIEKLAPFDITILLTGGTGSGKTTLAKKIHKLSGLKGDFVSLNCGAIPENLFESELYGYEKGAFTGAEKSGRKGLAETAENGTLLLDEISELPMSQQVKLLDFLEERKIRRVGGNRPIDVNCRVIAATNKDLSKQVAEGKFREDLFFRLNVASFRVPDLADRREDIVPMANLMLHRFNEKYNGNYVFSQEVLDAFMDYGWPGNLRELENIIHSMILTSSSEFLERDAIPFSIMKAAQIRQENYGGAQLTFDENESYKSLAEAFESQLFREYYKKYGSSVQVARKLGISQTTAARKIRKYAGELVKNSYTSQK